MRTRGESTGICRCEVGPTGHWPAPVVRHFVILSFCHWRDGRLRSDADMRGYRDLRVWQHAMDLVVKCYRATEKFPISERYGLTSQIRRAAVSIPANIAEGRSRRSPKEFIRFIRIAEGSEGELETLIELSDRLLLMPVDDSSELLKISTETAQMLRRLRESLR